MTPKQELILHDAADRRQLGAGDMAELRIEVDKTFVPALLPDTQQPDPRELGIRVFHAFVEPH